MRVVDDPYVLVRIIEDLGKDVPLKAPMYKSLTFLQEKALRKILTLPLPPDLESKMKELATKRLIDKGADRQMVRNLGPQLLKASVKEVRARLHSTNSAVRLVAIAVIVQRRLPLEEDLIAMLDEHDQTIFNAAHEALVRLARGTDFGPRPRKFSRDLGPSRRQLARIVAKWRHWLELQQRAQAEMTAHAPPRGDVTPVSRGAKPQPGAELLASSLGTELIQSRGPQQQSALRQLRQGEGRVYTDALARAIPELSGPIRDKARAALAERLTRLESEPFAEAFRDDHAEMRRAAARACVLRKDTGRVPELIRLLDDADAGVARAAHAALKELSGHDCGPADDASPEQRRQAATAWLAWWKSRSTRAK